MTDIWIFGNADCARSQNLHLDDGSRVAYFKMSAVELNMNKMEGYNRPDVIMNFNEPNDNLKKRQLIHGAPKDAQIINLY